jgi:nicotinamidase/pyrazinamidase
MRALIVVDVQKDFLPGGSLAVPEGNRILPFVNRVMADFEIVVATQDWHPSHHGSFASQHPGRAPGDRIDLAGLDQILWPDHCVEQTPGAELADELDLEPIARVFRKGTDPEIDSYSGFYDNGHRRSTGLADYLRGRGVTDVYIVGLATDYCVKFTALDALREGFTTHVLVDGCRGVELESGDVERALDEMSRAGAWILERYSGYVEPA